MIATNDLEVIAGILVSILHLLITTRAEHNKQVCSSRFSRCIMYRAALITEFKCFYLAKLNAMIPYSYRQNISMNIHWYLQKRYCLARMRMYQVNGALRQPAIYPFTYFIIKPFPYVSLDPAAQMNRQNYSNIDNDQCTGPNANIFIFIEFDTLTVTI